MKTKIPLLRGHIKVEIIDPEGLSTTVVDKYNTLVKEAPKLLLAQLVTPGTHANGATVPTSGGRPNVNVFAAGGTSNNALGYLRLGYYIEGTNVPSITVDAADHTMTQAAPGLVATKKIDSVTVEGFAIKAICDFQVTTGTANYNYLEAGLYTVGTNYSTGTLLAFSDAAYDAASSLMFAHQTHTAVQASAGSTIRYTWTITMEEPT